jgi:signal transduction histidine kinase
MVALGCSIVPAISGMFMLGSAPARRIAEIESGLWIALGAAATASTGAGSGAIVFFAVGLAMAWRSGDQRLMVEIGAFTLFGLALTVLVASGGTWLHPHDATIIASSFGIAALMQVGCVAVATALEGRPSSVAPLKPVAAGSADRELALKLKHAEGRVKQAARAAEEARIEANAARERLEARTTFFAQTSHELRTPLNAIVGFAEMMRNEVYGPLPERYQEYAGLIHEGGRNLTLVVDDVLDLARIESGRYEIFPEILSLTDHADDAVRFMSAEADRKFADPKAVRQIALNLISNGLKFTPHGGRVDVAALEVEGGALFSVSDTGEGIGPDELARLSRAFEQGEAGKRQKGAGLGLSVVRAFADLHGGRLDIESRSGGGTTISVFFPNEPGSERGSKDNGVGTPGEDGEDRLA